MARTPDMRSPSAPGRLVGRALESVCRRTCLGAALGTAVVGALFSPPLVTLVVAPAVGLFAASQAAVVHPGFPTQAGARRGVLLTGLGCALTTLVVMGASVLGTAGAVLVGTVLVTGAVVLAGWLSDLCGEGPAPASAVPDMAVLAEWIGAAPMSALVEQWRSSEQVLATSPDPGVRSATALARELLLDEMARRDPTGVQRWLREGAGASPAGHLRDDPAP